jgi:hypothetical protein
MAAAASGADLVGAILPDTRANVAPRARTGLLWWRDLALESPMPKPKRSHGRNAKAPSKAHDVGHLASVTVKDFKSLKDVHVDLGQVNVFIGANGAGKSCLLEAIGILGACAAGAVDDQALLRRGVRPGVPELYKSSFGDGKVAPKISLRACSKDGADYHAYITNPTKNPGPYWVFGNETLKDGVTTIASRGPKGNARALDLAVPLENNRSITTLIRASQRTQPHVRAMLSTTSRSFHR